MFRPLMTLAAGVLIVLSLIAMPSSTRAMLGALHVAATTWVSSVPHTNPVPRPLRAVPQPLAFASFGPIAPRLILPPILPSVPRTTTPAATGVPAKPAPIPKSPRALAGVRSGEELLEAIPLGETLTDMYATLGAPWLVAHVGTGISFWAYSVDNDRAWLVATIAADHHVVTVQLVQRNQAAASTLQDRAGVMLGQVRPGTPAPTTSAAVHGDDAVTFTAGSVLGTRRFSQRDRHGVICRLGATSENVPSLVALVRWFANTGWSPDRAILSSTYAGLGEEGYIAQLGNTAPVARLTYIRGGRRRPVLASVIRPTATAAEPLFHCGNGLVWRRISRQTVVSDGVSIDAVGIRCGHSAVKETVYFAQGNKAPRPFTSDPLAHLMVGLTASVVATNGGNRGAYASRRASLSSNGTGTTGTIFPYNNTYGLCVGCGSDFDFHYTDDPNNPLTSVTLNVVAPPDASQRSSAVARQSLGIRHARAAQAAQIPCSFSGGNAKCVSGTPFAGANCFSVTAMFGVSPVISKPLCQLNIADFWNVPHPRPCSGTAGAPIEASTGKLWYTGSDGDLSGPFGLSVFHRYDTENAATSNDLGFGWHQSYGEYLDLTGLNDATDPGQVVYHSSTCQLDYFNVDAGNVYDPYSGDSLLANSDGTYTLTTWSHAVFIFDTAGRLSSVSDRAGNKQTIVRNAAHRISTVTDALGRTLAYSYDAQNRITKIASTPAAISVTFQYDSGTGCYSGDLCSATESDGSVWTYQYYNASSYGGAHMLLSVTDPLGHIEESNTYTTQTVNGQSHYFASKQTYSGGKNALSFSYVSDFETDVTDANGNVTEYLHDLASFLPTFIIGPLCKCNGAVRNIGYDSFGKRQFIGDDLQILATYSYADDVTATSPDGSQTYISQSYPKPTSIEQDGITVMPDASTTSRVVTIKYYPLGDARQDLPNTISEPSVDSPSNSVTSTYVYNSQGLLTSATRAGYVNGVQAPRSISASYDSRGRVLTSVGPRTDVTQKATFAYYSDTDADLARRGQLQSVTDALGHQTIFAGAAAPFNTYSPYGDAFSFADPNGIVTDRTYDKLGRLTQQTLKGVTNDTADLTTTYSYDLAGRLTSHTQPLANRVGLMYDAVNNVTGEVRFDASGYQREEAVYGYDAGSRRVSTALNSCTLPSSSCSTWATAYSVASAYTTNDQDTYDSFPGVAGSGGTVRTYDGVSGQITAVAYGSSPGSSNESNENDWSFDQNRLVYTITEGQSSSVGMLNLRYDLQLNIVDLSTLIDDTRLAFDDFGEPKTQSSQITGATSQTYDKAGNVLTRTDANGATTTSTYDALNRRTSAISSRSGHTTETVRWTYDSATAGAFGIGKLASMTDPSGSTSYTYERRSLLASTVKTVGSSSYTTRYKYDGNGNCISISLPSGRVLSYTFDFADRPLSVKGGSTTYVSSASYAPFGPFTQLVFGNGTTQTWTVNQRYLPVEDKVTSSSATLIDQTYTQEAAGYTSSTTDKLNAANSRQYSYIAGGNQLASIKTASNSSWGSFSTYVDQVLTTLATTDTSGKLVTNTVTLGDSVHVDSYQTTVGSGATVTQAVSEDAVGNEAAVGSSSYSYSPRNLLSTGDGISYSYDGFGSRVSATASTGTRVSLYDPQAHLQAESSLTSSAIGYDYIWFGDRPVAQEDVGGQTHWTADDDLGAPILQTTSSGSAYWQAVYAPFGSIYSLSTPDAHQPIRRPGQEAEEFAVGNPNGATSRYYNGARWYRPTFGRYTQADPLGFDGGQYNFYSYAENNPLNEVDPLGLDPTGAAIGAFGGSLIGGGIGGLLGGAGGAAAGTLAGPGGTVVGAGFGGAEAGTAGAFIGAGLGASIGDVIGNGISRLGDNFNEARGSGSEPDDTSPNLPAGSLPIDQTPWSGDHTPIKEAVGAGGADNVFIDPDGNVWGENPDGTYTNHGQASGYVLGAASGRSGSDRGGKQRRDNKRSRDRKRGDGC